MTTAAGTEPDSERPDSEREVGGFDELMPSGSRREGRPGAGVLGPKNDHAAPQLTLDQLPWASKRSARPFCGRIVNPANNLRRDPPPPGANFNRFWSDVLHRPSQRPPAPQPRSLNRSRELALTCSLRVSARRAVEFSDRANPTRQVVSIGWPEEPASRAKLTQSG